MALAKPPLSVLPLPALRTLFEAARIQVVDLGARGTAYGPLTALAPFTHYVACEPDAPEAERIQRELTEQAHWRAVTVMTEAIAAERGSATLFITNEPGMSSLLEPDPLVAGKFYLARKFRVASTATVPTLPLDEAAARYGFEDAAFLKIDTQGTELEILQSGPRLLERAVGVYTESLFHPIYKGQAVFSDVDSLLRREGFTLFTLNRTMLRRWGYRKSVYSKRMIAWAHALYFREPESLLAGAVDDVPRRLLRLLAFALTFNHFDLAFETAALVRRACPRPLVDPDQLDRDVEACADYATKEIVGQGEKHRPVDLLSSSLRDKTRVE